MLTLFLINFMFIQNLHNKITVLFCYNIFSKKLNNKLRCAYLFVDMHIFCLIMLLMITNKISFYFTYKKVLLRIYYLFNSVNPS